MATYVSNRDGGKTDEQGHYRFQTKVWNGNVLNGLTVTQNSPAAMSVLVTEGDLKIDYSDYAYTAWNDSDSVVTIATADGSNPRIDRIVAYIDRGMTPSTANSNNPGMLKFMAVAGTPGAVPVAPNDAAVNAAVGASNPWTELARVAVGAGVSTISNGNITDYRTIISIPSQILRSIYPVGSIYTNASVSTNPSTLLGFGTWEEFGKGRVLVGVDSGQTEFDTLGETGGAKTHTLTTGQLPSHSHSIPILTVRGGTRTLQSGSGADVRELQNTAGANNNPGNSQASTTGNQGSGEAHNNLQPYVTVYMWKRTA